MTLVDLQVTSEVRPTTQEVHVWCLDLSANPPLSYEPREPADAERAAAYVREEDRQRFLAGRLLLRAALGFLHDLDPEEVRLDSSCSCGRNHGRPHDPGLSADASLSHSGDIVVVAASRDCRMGIDIEQMKPAEDLHTLAALILHPQEQWPSSMEEFYVYWCRKEAITKALGTGLRQPFQHVRVSSPNEPPRLLSVDSQPLSCELAELDLRATRRPEQAYAGAVAALTDRPLELVHHVAGTAGGAETMWEEAI